MPWVKLDDAFFNNPRAIKAGKDGRSLYIAALCWCRANFTDGRIPEQALPLLAVQADVNGPKIADRLVEVGLWHEDGNDWLVNDWLDYHEPAEVEKARRNRDAMRKRQWRDGGRDASRDAGQDADATRESTRPKPKPKPIEKEPPQNSTRGHPAEAAGCPKCRCEVFQRGRFEGVRDREAVIRHRTHQLHAEGWCQPPPDPELTQAASTGAALARSGAPLSEVRDTYSGQPVHIIRAAENAWHDVNGGKPA